MDYYSFDVPNFFPGPLKFVIYGESTVYCTNTFRTRLHGYGNKSEKKTQITEPGESAVNATTAAGGH